MSDTNEKIPLSEYEVESILESCDENSIKEKATFIEEDDTRLTKEERDQYALEYCEYTRKLAYRYFVHNGTVNFDDVYSAANMGLVKALNGFNKKITVSTFGTFLHQCVKREIIDFYRKLNKQKTISLDEMAEKDYVSQKNYAKTTDMTKNIADQGDIIDNTAKTVEEEAVSKNMVEILNNIIENDLTDTQQFIIRAYYGLGDIEKMTQTEIGSFLNISQVMVNRYLKDIEKTLKKIFVYRYHIDNFSL